MGGGVHAQACLYVCEGHRLKLGLFLNCFSPLSSEQCPLKNLELSARLDRLESPPAFFPCGWDYKHAVLAFYTWVLMTRV